MGWKGKVAGALAMGAVMTAACDDATGPEDVPSFLAIVTSAEGPPEVPPGTWTMRIRELSGTLDYDRSVQVEAGDTVIVTPPPATYEVTLEEVPEECGSRFGLKRQSVVNPAGATSIVRFNIVCAPMVVLVTATDGRTEGLEYVYRLTGPGGLARTGRVQAVDTIRFAGLTPGQYTAELSFIDPDCVVWSDGLRSQVFEAEPYPRTARAVFRLTCSNPTWGPELLHFRSSYQDGAVGFHFEAFDPGNERNGFGDIERYMWDITDCKGSRVRQGSAFTFGGLSALSARTTRQDTVQVVMAYPMELPGGQIQGRCVSLRVIDFDGNTTRVLEESLAPGSGQPPRVTNFDARLTDPEGDPGIEIVLDASDPDGDLIGSFLTFTLADGTVGEENGRPDVWIPSVVGELGTELPRIRVASMPFDFDALVDVTVRVMDREGNFTTVRDEDFGG